MTFEDVRRSDRLFLVWILLAVASGGTFSAFSLYFVFRTLGLHYGAPVCGL